MPNGGKKDEDASLPKYLASSFSSWLRWKGSLTWRICGELTLPGSNYLERTKKEEPALAKKAK